MADTPGTPTRRHAGRTFVVTIAAICAVGFMRLVLFGSLRRLSWSARWHAAELTPTWEPFPSGASDWCSVVRGCCPTDGATGSSTTGLTPPGVSFKRGKLTTQDMKDSLVQAGGPAARIYCGYAGFRPLDSIVRDGRIFGQTQITVISQEFHNERAIFIARYRGVDAIGFNAPEVDAYDSFKTKCRELIARANMLLDLFVFGRAPRFLGDKVTIPA